MAPTNTPRETSTDYVIQPGKKPGMASPHVRRQPKIGRNEKCPCGSGKKNKKCCKTTLS